jgi:hypothetical protein
MPSSFARHNSTAQSEEAELLSKSMTNHQPKMAMTSRVHMENQLAHSEQSHGVSGSIMNMKRSK